MPKINIADHTVVSGNGKPYTYKNKRTLVLSWNEGEHAEQEAILNILGSKQVTGYIMRLIYEDSLYDKISKQYGYLVDKNDQILKLLRSMVANGTVSSIIPEESPNVMSSGIRMEDIYEAL